MHIYLIGYRGSGKSTVGRLLAMRLGRAFVDTDDEIEAASNMSIREIFERDGEPGFRDREQRAIELVTARTTPTIVALGGGAVLREANQQLISSSGYCVWMKGSAEHLYQRISGDNSTSQRRPNLSSHGGFDEVVEILAKREPVYDRLSRKTVVTDGKTPDEIVAEIEAWVNSLASCPS